MSMTRQLAEGHRYTKLLESQTVPVEIMLCRTPSGEAVSRIACQAMATKISPTPKYVCVADPDRVCCDSNNNYKPNLSNIEDAINFLESNNDFGAISLTYPSKGREEDDKNPHIDIGFVLYRMDILMKLKFDYEREQHCFCLTVTKQIRDMGYRFGYLDNLNRITHF